MFKAYLKAKTFDELIIKQQMMSKLAGREYKYNESFFARGYFYVTYEETSYERFLRVSKIIEDRFKSSKKKPKKENNEAGN